MSIFGDNPFRQAKLGKFKDIIEHFLILLKHISYDKLYGFTPHPGIYI